MADLILTDEEKAAHLWVDLDDASLGKVVKYVSAELAKHPRAHSSVISGAAPDDDAITWCGVMLLLVGSCVERKADTFRTELHGLTHKKEEWGDWEIMVKRIDE